jgi:hypothetical protein
VFFQAFQALLKETFAPHADNFSAGIQLGSDLIIADPLGCEENHFGPNYFNIR